MLKNALIIEHYDAINDTETNIQAQFEKLTTQKNIPTMILSKLGITQISQHSLLISKILLGGEVKRLNKLKSQLEKNLYIYEKEIKAIQHLQQKHDPDLKELQIERRSNNQSKEYYKILFADLKKGKLKYHYLFHKEYGNSKHQDHYRSLYNKYTSGGFSESQLENIAKRLEEYNNDAQKTYKEKQFIEKKEELLLIASGKLKENIHPFNISDLSLRYAMLLLENKEECSNETLVFEFEELFEQYLKAKDDGLYTQAISSKISDLNLRICEYEFDQLTHVRTSSVKKIKPRTIIKR